MTTKHEMPALTEEQRQALIAEIEYNRKNCFLSSKTEILMQIAESCLNAKPVGIFANRIGTWIELCPGDAFEHPDKALLYTAPPVHVLKPVVLPGAERLDGNGYGYYFDMNDVSIAIENAGYPIK